MGHPKEKTDKTLPKIPDCIPLDRGTVCQQWVRCSRANCRCASGRREDRHPAFYAFWREDGRLRKHYLSAEVAPLVAWRCEERRRQQREHRALAQHTMDEWRELRAALRAQEALLHQGAASVTERVEEAAEA